ncbi:hypothetical protein Tco_1119303 [Tanacetum coccineum]
MSWSCLSFCNILLLLLFNLALTRSNVSPPVEPVYESPPPPKKPPTPPPSEPVYEAPPQPKDPSCVPPPAPPLPTGPLYGGPPAPQMPGNSQLLTDFSFNVPCGSSLLEVKSFIGFYFAALRCCNSFPVRF